MDKKSSTEALIKITLKEGDYQPKVEEKIKEYARKATLKGFRPGKVPRGIIQKMYGKSILVDEINHLLSHTLSDYIKENKIQLLGEPLPNKEQIKAIEWENQQEFNFEYEIGMADEFTVDLSKKKKVTSYTIKVDKKEVDETIENLRKQSGTHSNPETSEDTDILSGELSQPETEINNKTAIEISQLDKKLQKTFIGKNVDDVITFDLRKVFKEDNDVAVHTGKTPEEVTDLKGKVEFKVETISRPEAAALDQALFDQIFGPGNIKDEAEFRQKVEESIGSNYKREADTLLIRDIQDSLIKSTKLAMPDDFLKKWLLETNEDKLSQADIDKEYETYARELKWNLIKNRIAEDNELKVEHQEVVDTTKNMIRSQFGAAASSPQIEENLEMFADNYLKGEDGNNYMRVFNQVQADKIFDLVKEKITISEKKVSLDQFKKIALN